MSADEIAGSSDISAAVGFPLRIGIVADSPTFPGDWNIIRENVRLADSLGYDSVWLGEAWGYELFTSLADLRARDHTHEARRGCRQYFLALARADRHDRRDTG